VSDFAERIAKLSPQRLALLVLELQKRLDAQEHLRREPIAVVGLGCRFPGAASPDAFWRLLSEGRDAIVDVPPERWDADAYHHSEPGTPGKMYTRRGGFLKGIDGFDPHFFGISPREAVSLDPQQRLLLEVSWEALEHAGIAADGLMGSPTGVFVGACHMDYLELFEDLSLVDAYVATGNSLSLASGRLSYVLGLRGPSLTVDTACSSSLVAVHLACQSLRLGECRLALAGGTNLVVTPKTSVALCELRALSPTGRCHTFDARADGYVRGEGCGVVILKRLSDAQRDGDNVLAIIRGSAVNQDGRSGGLTAPHGPSQEAVIREALKSAGVEPSAVGYVEAHGTGTALGDPIEIQALAAVFGAGRSAEKPLVVGSVKTNVGHLEAAAGAAGLIKVILALTHGQIPPHLDLKGPNPHIPWNEVPVTVPAALIPWPAGSGKRLAGISSFGFSGTNAHTVLEEAPAPAASPTLPDRPLHLLALSARDENALRQLAGLFARHLETHPEEHLADVCLTASTGRSQFAHRLAVVSATLDESCASLSAFASGTVSASVQSGKSDRERPSRVGFLFTGQGSQYAGMGRELYQTSPLFRRELDNCSDLLRPHLDRPLLEVLYPDEGQDTPLNQTGYAQSALFALEYALCRLWQSWGVQPSAVLGHSLGEYVAACVAGVLSLENALTLVATRARLMQALPPGGAMAALLAPEEQIEAALADFAGRLSLAALNGSNTVVSGDAEAVDQLLSQLEQQGVRGQRLQVSHAFHSARMEPALAPFRQAAAGVEFSAPRLSLVSNLTGRLFAAGHVADADYWCQHLRQPVRFAEGVRALRDSGVDVLVEIGPQPTLLGMARRCLPEEEDCLWLPSIRRGQGDWQTLLDSLAGLYTRGVTVDWAGFHKDGPGRRLHLPTYPFQRERFWVEATTGPRSSSVSRANGQGHRVLGQRLRSPLRDVQFEFPLSIRTRPALRDHRVYHTVVVPASWHVALLLTAAEETGGAGPRRLEDVTFPEAVVLAEADERTIQLVLTPGSADGQQTCRVHGSNNAGGDSRWAVHAEGTLLAGDGQMDSSPSLATLQDRCPREDAVEPFYRMIWDGGIQLDACFRWIERLWTGTGEALCRMRRPRSGEDEGYALPPGLVDSCFQLVAATIPGARDVAAAYVPFGIDRLHYLRKPRGVLWAHAALRPGQSEGSEVFTADLLLFEESGQVVAAIEGLHLKRAARETLLRGLQGRADDTLYEIAWRPLPDLPEPVAQSGNWLILADRGGIGEALAAKLRDRGNRCFLARGASSDNGEYPGEDQWQIDPANPGELARLLGAISQPLQGVVYLWALDADETPERWEEAQRLGCGNALLLLQAIMHSGMPLPALWLVTRGAQSVGAQAVVAPAQASLWGLGRTIPLEHPDLKCVCVDLDPETEVTKAGIALLAEVLAPSGESQVAVRAGIRHGARLVHHRGGIEGVSLHADATYLITGGLGDLGLLVARGLIERGARYLVLVSRRPAAEAQSTLTELEATGARVVCVQADIAVTGDMEVLQQTLSSLPPLRGVIHAAGVLDNAVLVEQDWSKFARVLAPKVAGAWNLHQLTRDRELDFFVLFSSAASLLGSPGQGNYAAANAFLDALAHHRRALGLPALSINWGPWGAVGMAARVDERQKQRWASQGVGAIEPARGVDILGRLLSPEGPAQTGVLVVAWEKFLRQFPAGTVPSVLAEVAPQHDKLAAPPEASLLRLLEDTPLDEREERVLEYVRAEAARVLRLPPGRTLDARQPLGEVGMDSLMAVELRNRLGAAVGRTLPAALLFSHPTVAQMTAYLIKEIIDLKGTAGKKPATDDAPRAKVSPNTAEPIAVVGLACRLPGARDADEFWQMLREGREGVREVPPERWDVEAYYDSDPETPGKMYTRRAGFLSCPVDQFDAAFFGIAPREAINMDPQQRLLLEVAWEALENAGIAADRLSSSPTAVYLGISTSDYAQMQLKGTGLPGINAYTGTGNAFSVAAGRISYVLGLQGPNFPVDTACSSSLVAVHLACQSLRSGECNLALAAGVNLILTPEGLIYFCKLRALSPGGRCHTFDARADGYVRGEGCGVVVLKRLADAQRDGDNILAVIRGSAVNHDGRSNGLTAPNGAAQEAVIREALRAAGVEPGEVGYIEAHGTGTSLGDPVEVGALASVLGPGRSKDQPFLLGSVKTNIGHLEAGAGVSSLIKAVLILKNGEIPPHLNFERPSPLIPWDEVPVQVPTTPVPWPTNGRRIAGVSSFGFSGTNVHVVLEAAPPLKTPPVVPDRPRHLLTLSAPEIEPQREQARRLADHLSTNDSLSLSDVCFTLNTGRSQFAHRLAVVSGSVGESCASLSAFASGTVSPGVQSGKSDRERPPRVGFLFTGQGSQYAGMGRELYQTSPLFRRELDNCSDLLRPHLDRPLLEVLYPNDGQDTPLDQTGYAQPALFALEYALCRLWQSWGVQPVAVLGHSLGEYVAACVAGVLSLEDALSLVATRARLMQALPPGGAMAALLAPQAQVESALAAFGDRLSLAALNGSNTVVSGDAEAVNQLLEQLQQQGVEGQRLQVSHAFHSARMEPALAELERAASALKHSSPGLRLVSNLTGQVAGAGDLGPGYWAHHARQPVHFAQGVQALRDLGCEILVEIGSQPTLLGMARRCLPEGSPVSFLPSVRRGVSDWQTLLESLAALYVQGVSIDWAAFDRDYHRRKVTLPTYPFQRQRFWLEADGLHGPGSVSAGTSTADWQDWLYELAWEPAPRQPAEEPPSVPLRWLVFADPGGCGAGLARQLEERGDRCVQVVPGSTTALQEDGRWILDPTRPESFQTLLQGICRPEDASLHGVVYLWSLEEAAGELTLESLGDAQTLGCRAVLGLAQSLAGLSSPPRLWILTRTAQSAGSAPLAPAQAPLWGLGRVLAQEHPGLRCVMVDLDQVGGLEQLDSLFEEVCRPDSEDQVAWRGGQRLVPRLVRHRLPAEDIPFPCRVEGSYLITGGLGALGLRVASWLIERGARHLMLVGRRGAEGIREDALEELRQKGAEVRVCKADVSIPGDVARLLAEMDAMPPLRGVIHAAGVLDDGVLVEQAWGRFEKVLASKVQGAWNLHQSTCDRELDFFVLFSSAASVLGSPGQANYAAANAFLDALAHHRRALGLPALSVNWGPWQGEGMAAGLGERLAARGLGQIDSGRGLEILGYLLTQRTPQVTVLPVDWKVFLRQFGPNMVPPLFRNLAVGMQPEGIDKTSDRNRLKELLHQVPPSERRQRLADFVSGEVARILGQVYAGAIDPNRPLMELGLDSLMAVELRNALARNVPVDLPATLLFDQPTVTRLADYLLREAFPELFPAGPETREEDGEEQKERLLAEVGELSAEEMEALIDQELGRLRDG
jgi:acyl transferase domain-containing protein/acyl carrier protein